jgi:serine/threonine-protein kinase
LFLVGTGRARTTKVLDFGISRVGEAAAKLTKTGTVMGTPTYMPPEQARGRRVDQRADIYSVGAILYEALTGRRPFTGTDSMSILAAVLSEDPPRPCGIAPAIPPGLELVIQKAMAKSPKERYRTMRDLDEALAEFDSREQRLAEQHGHLAQTDAARKSLLFGVLAASSRAPELARTSLAVHSIGGGVLALAAAVEVTLAAAHLARGAAPLTGTEVFFASLGSMGVLLAPCAVWAFYVVTRVWNNTPRVLAVLDRTRYVLGASLGAYCAVTITLHILSFVLRVEPSSLTWPGWGLLSCVLAAIAGVMAARVTLRVQHAAASEPHSVA